MERRSGKKEKKNEGKWTGKVEIRTRKKFQAVGEACVNNNNN